MDPEGLLLMAVFGAAAMTVWIVMAIWVDDC